MKDSKIPNKPSAALTEISKSGGCSGKISKQSLRKILPRDYENPIPGLVVGFKDFDDAAVMEFDQKKYLVSTVDVITPPVDDPDIFGKIAAANALSDVYAMGGHPISCLNIAGFPRSWSPDILGKILRGAISKIEEAGAAFVGGHAIHDEQPWFGLSVNGKLEAENLWRNCTPKEGDVLIFTKPIGSGYIFSANKAKIAEAAHLEQCIYWAQSLNKGACEVMKNYTVHAATDVTGYGLLGHLMEMLSDKYSCELYTEKLHILDGVMKYREAGLCTSISADNLEFVQQHIDSEDYDFSIPIDVLSDPQTNGGMLFSVPNVKVSNVIERLRENGYEYTEIIGLIIPKKNASIYLK